MHLSIWQSDLNAVDMWRVELFVSSPEEAVSFSIFYRIDTMQGHPGYGISATGPVSLNLQNNIVTFQWHVID